MLNGPLRIYRYTGTGTARIGLLSRGHVRVDFLEELNGGFLVGVVGRFRYNIHRPRGAVEAVPGLLRHCAELHSRRARTKDTNE